MENIFVAIITDDKEYARSLSLAILSICRSFIIRIFSAEEFLDENRNFDIVLWDGEEVKEAYGGRIIYLAQKPSEVVRNSSDKRFCIYKYCSAGSMVSSIFEIYEALTGRRAVNLRRQNVRLFAFSSPSGGSGCTTLAMSVAQEFCRFRGKSVLYLSFEELESTGEFIKQEGGVRGATVYLYELFNNMIVEDGVEEKEEKVPFLDGHMIKDDFGVEAFASSAGRNPLRELHADELNKFTAALVDSGRYDVIIADLGQWLSKTALKYMEMVEKICIVKEYGRNVSREEQYISHLISNCGETAVEKIIKISNCISKEPELGAEEEGKKGDDNILIRKCKSFIREDGYTKILLEGEFGSDIDILATMIDEPL